MTIDIVCFSQLSGESDNVCLDMFNRESLVAVQLLTVQNLVFVSPPSTECVYVGGAPLLWRENRQVYKPVSGIHPLICSNSYPERQVHFPNKYHTITLIRAPFSPQAKVEYHSMKILNYKSCIQNITQVCVLTYYQQNVLKVTTVENSLG